jgi:TadE-like protein
VILRSSLRAHRPVTRPVGSICNRHANVVCRDLAPGCRVGADGGFATLEFAALFPLVLLSIAMVLQLSLWGYRRTVAIATAQDMAAAAAVRGSADSEFLHLQLTNHGLGGLNSLATSVSVVPGDGGGDRVQVVLSGSMPSFIGLFTLPIHAVASAPVERFRP